ncbi:hypothetical protein KLP40_01630 [Hymenobacter sp. NST-14]|uniref:hypothetical protein n=1 Tax=Hymenobacter piscis TaxID=2839984 RepID=UPI001C00EFDB|nr:hypothetical protein [Hymenobacter piscis]MBT9391849.1 hypothetical protein [Hymenobacter piscis]
MHNALLLLTCFAGLLATSAHAQPGPVKKNKNIGLFNITQLGSSSGLGQVRFPGESSFRHPGALSRLRTTFGYFLKPELSVGLGLGLEAYDVPKYAFAPLVADMRYYRRPAQSSLFAVATAGHTVSLTQEFGAGLTGGLGVGYRLIAGRATHLLFSTGLETHQVRDARLSLFYQKSAADQRHTVWLNSVAAHVGLLF